MKKEEQELFTEFIRLKEGQGVYGSFPGALAIHPANEVQATAHGAFPLPTRISPGTYKVCLTVVKKGRIMERRRIPLETSKDFNIPEIKLIRAIHDAPSILESSTFGKERYLAHIESTLLGHMEKDNMVYHGLAGHFFVKHISHVLKVRIIADLEERLKIKMQQEKTSRQIALEGLKKDDHERREWSLKLYGLDTWYPSLYELVLHVHILTVENAADIICYTVKLERFRTTPESQRVMDDLALAARVKAKIVERYPNSKVTAREGEVLVHIQASETLEPAIEEDIQGMVEGVVGVKKVRVHVVPTTLFDGHI